jgi:hypothetical protein
MPVLPEVENVRVEDEVDSDPAAMVVYRTFVVNC